MRQRVVLAAAELFMTVLVLSLHPVEMVEEMAAREGQVMETG